MNCHNQTKLHPEKLADTNTKRGMKIEWKRVFVFTTCQCQRKQICLASWPNSPLTPPFGGCTMRHRLSLSRACMPSSIRLYQRLVGNAAFPSKAVDR